VQFVPPGIVFFAVTHHSGPERGGAAFSIAPKIA
jgi:hypothetical protein